MLDGVRHGKDPDERLKESERRGDRALSTDREDDAHRVARNIDDAQKENEQRTPRRSEQPVDGHDDNLAAMVGCGPRAPRLVPRVLRSLHAAARAAVPGYQTRESPLQP